MVRFFQELFLSYEEIARLQRDVVLPAEVSA